MGVQVITSPSNPRENWLIETVKRQADQAGIGMPEVASSHPTALTHSLRVLAAIML